MDGIDPFSPAAYGLSTMLPDSSATSTSPGLARSAVNAVEHPLSPQSGLFIAGLLIAATFGLIAVSSSARLGTARVGASVGKP